MSDRGTPERLAELQQAFATLAVGAREMKAYTAIYADETPALVMEFRLADKATAEAADCIFAGNDDALHANGGLFYYGGMKALNDGICRLCKEASDD